MIFDNAFEFVMQWEGGDTITDDPDDPGGLTKYGISQKAYPDLDIRNLAEDHAKQIYFRDYWMKSKVNKLPDALKLAHFDSAVNTGPDRAIKLLQKALRVEADGDVGKKTLAAVNDQGESALASMLAYRALFYIGLVTRKPKLSKFMFGWLRRIFSVAIQTKRI